MDKPKVPFGFRPEAEPAEKVKIPDAAAKEISNTSLVTERKWSPTIIMPAESWA